MASQAWLGLPLAVVLGPPVLAAAFVANLLTVYRQQKAGRKVRNYSSLIMVLEAEPREIAARVTQTSVPVSLEGSVATPPEVPRPEVAVNLRYATRGLV
jgi:hypothetical protein